MMMMMMIIIIIIIVIMIIIIYTIFIAPFLKAIKSALHVIKSLKIMAVYHLHGQTGRFTVWVGLGKW